MGTCRKSTEPRCDRLQQSSTKAARTTGMPNFFAIYPSTISHAELFNPHSYTIFGRVDDSTRHEMTNLLVEMGRKLTTHPFYPSLQFILGTIYGKFKGQGVPEMPPSQSQYMKIRAREKSVRIATFR